MFRKRYVLINAWTGIVLPKRYWTLRGAMKARRNMSVLDIPLPASMFEIMEIV